MTKHTDKHAIRSIPGDVRTEEHPAYTVQPGPDRAARQTDANDEIVRQALAILASRLRKPGHALTCSDSTRTYLRLQLAEREHEVFAILYLDNQHRVIAFEELFRGTIDGAAVYPREVVKAALRHNAAAVILTHNHPSGNEEPSTADQAITDRLKRALQTVDIRVLDHVIVAGMRTTSFAERGMI